MDPELIFDNKKFLSSRRAGELVGYTNDYVARLARKGKVIGRMVGRTWYVEEESFRDFLSLNIVVKEKRNHELSLERKHEYKETVLPSTEHGKEFSNTLSHPSRFSFLKTVGVFAALVMIVFAPFILTEYRLTSFVQFISLEKITLSEEIPEVVLGSVGSFIGDMWDSAFSNLRLLVMKTFSTLSRNDEQEDSTVSLIKERAKAREGVVVVPSSDIGGDESAKKKEIQDAFSDEVAILQDTDGRAGIIKPVFKTAEAEDYLYVLVPIDETDTE